MMSIWSKFNRGLSLFLVLLIFSCDQKKEGYEHLEEGVQFKIQSLGEEDFVAAIGQYVSFKIRIFNSNSQEIYRTNKKGIDKHEYFLFTHSKSGAIQRGLQKFQEGDSVSFIMAPNLFQEQFPYINLDSSSTNYLVEFKLSHIEDKEQRENRLNAKFNQAMLREEILISEYFEANGNENKFVKWKGLYFNAIRQGVKADRNENLELSYTAFFLDGGILDATTDSTNLKYSFGESAQVIEGLNLLISKIGIGGKAEAIIPSNLAFGDVGSTSDLVPPSTPLRYVVSVKRDTSSVKI